MDAATAVAQAHRREWAFVLAATVRLTRDIDLAEECVQEAYAQALVAWDRNGVPNKPGAWLTTTARRRALDELRRDAVLRRKLPLLIQPAELDEQSSEADVIPDDRLRLIFTCCHPALAESAQVALTLRLVCGLTTAEVAKGFLVSEPTMAARITRAKKKIAAARIPYRVPSAEELPARLDAVLNVVYLLFTTGHTAPSGSELMRRDLIERSLDVARILRGLLPTSPEVAGLLGLLLVTDARREARVDSLGLPVLLADQDRTKWDQRASAEGIALAREALRHRPPSRYSLQAAIAAVHARAPSYDDTDWSAIISLYDELCQIWPSPVVSLNRAVAIGLAGAPEAGLAALDKLLSEPQLAGYPYLQASRAEFLRRLGDRVGAVQAYEEAVLLTSNDAERRLIETRLAELS